MKISCPACAAKYSIADEKVQDKLAKIRCRKCGTTIVIDGKVSPPAVHAGDPGASHADSPAVSDPGAAQAGEYSVDFGDNDQRSMSVADIVAAYNAGQITAETFVWADGMGDWQPLGQVTELVDALHAASSPAAASPAAPAVSAPAATPAFGGTPWDAAPAASPVESASALRAAARPGGGRGSTADLFGSMDPSGVEGDVTTSAPPGPSPAAASATSQTGARNESSVLFSLSALTSAAKPASAAAVPAISASASLPAAGSNGAGTREDSGLIDLKALTAAAESPAAAPMPVLTAAPLGMPSPLGLAAPFGGGVEAQIAAPHAQKSRAGLYIGAGIAVAAVAIAGAIIVTGRKQELPPQPTAVAQQPAPPPTAAPPATTEEPTTAKPPATGAAEDTKPGATKTAAAKRPGGGVAVKPKPGGESTSGAATKPPSEGKKPPAAKAPCGCAPGDLQCAMKCAAGR